MNKRRALLSLAALPALGSLYSPAALAEARVPAARLQLGQRPRLPAVRTIDGRKISLEGLRGKVLVLTYFATNCPFCVNEAPKLEKLYRESRGKLIVVGVNIETGDQDQFSKTQQWVRRFGLTHPVTIDFKALESVLGTLIGLPVNHIFDATGKAVRIDTGEIFDEDFDDIKKFIGK